jgi:osmotically-inducible protein OsmY
MKSDSDIKRDVDDELRWDPNVHADDIAIAVTDGVVELTGFVTSYAAKSAAESAAQRVAGVLGVADDLEVRLPGIDQRPDPDIARDAVGELKTGLPDSWENIKAVVNDGLVTLDGEVEWNYQRENAEMGVNCVTGVKGVNNLISLKPKPVPAPGDIKQQIERAFRRSALIDANRITVEADGGEVTLEGTVRSWAERQEAERAAWSGPGVFRVDNRIVVSP